jgi:hypothetical protein
MGCGSSLPPPVPSPATPCQVYPCPCACHRQGPHVPTDECDEAASEVLTRGVPDFEGDTHVVTQSESSFMEPVISADRVWCLGLRCGHEVNIISGVHRPNIKGNEWRCDRCAEIAALHAALKKAEEERYSGIWKTEASRLSDRMSVQKARADTLEQALREVAEGDCGCQLCLDKADRAAVALKEKP